KPNLAQARILQYLPVFQSPSESSLAQARPSRSSENLAMCPILQDCHHILRRLDMLTTVPNRCDSRDELAIRESLFGDPVRMRLQLRGG
ncbi:hypothetical protein Lal_00011346, partial [Lupinus albus]